MELICGTCLVNAWYAHRKWGIKSIKILTFHEEIIYHLLNIVNPHREEMPSENEVLPQKRSHFLQSYQEPASKTKRRCKESCKRISRIKGREYAAKRTKKVTTYCDRCKSQPAFCLTCFKKLHEERK